MNTKKIGFVLSGGAACGLANLGVLEVFEEAQVPCHCIAGSSMGSIVAGLYALGIPLPQAHELVCNLKLLDVARISGRPLQGGLQGGLLRQRLEELLPPVVGDARIADCRIPFICVAGLVTQPISWSQILFSGFTEKFLAAVQPHVFPPETRLLDALLASSAIPVLFSPVTIGTQTFVDLIHFGAIPARTLRSLQAPDVVIGTDTFPRYDRLRTFLPRAWREFIDRGHTELAADKQTCDVVISPTMPANSARFDRGRDFIEAGRKAAASVLPAVRRLLDNA